MNCSVQSTASCFIIFSLLFMSSCFSQDSTALANDQEANQQGQSVVSSLDSAAQIGDFVVEIFEDSKGNLWFGTMSKGVACFDGKTLRYYSTKNGLAGNTVVSIVEDKTGTLWFGTHFGLSKFDGLTFTNYTRQEGLCHNRVSSLLIDQLGTLWVGTWGGVCQFNGVNFAEFPLPTPQVDLLPYQSTMDWVTQVAQDKQGNIWITRDGYGACKYDGLNFTHYTKKDGLPSNNVQAIQEDKQGNIWFGCRVAERDNPDPDGRTGDGGVCRFDGQSFTSFPTVEGLSRNEIYSIYLDKKGHIWIGATGLGIYRHDPASKPSTAESFQLYKGTDRMDLTAGFGVQSILEDRNGTFWFGFSGGLFRLDGSSIINVPQGGPWK